MSGRKRTTLADLQARRSEPGDDVGEGDEGDQALREFEATGNLPPDAESDVQPMKPFFVGANEQRHMDEEGLQWVFSSDTFKVYLKRNHRDRLRLRIVKRMIYFALHHVMPRERFSWEALLDLAKEFERRRI
jgi:hypothetical protein